MEFSEFLECLLYFFAGYGLFSFIIDTKPKFDKMVDKYLK